MIYTAPTDAIAEQMRQQPAEWLPVRSVIRSAGQFALSRYGGDNALAAYVDGLSAVGVNIPEPRADVTRYAARYSRRTPLHITPTVADEPSEAESERAFLIGQWNQYRNGMTYRSDGMRRIHAILASRGYTEVSTYGAYPDIDYSDGMARPYVQVETDLRRIIVNDEDAATVNAEWRAEADRAADSIDRMVIRDLLARGITATPWNDGLTEDRTYASASAERRSQRLSTRVELAANDADRLATAREFITTDAFLAMMRDQAVSNHWCPEHHSIINDLTGGTRGPFGVRATVTINVQQTFTVDVTSFYGGDGSLDGIRERIEYAAERFVNTAQDNYTNAQFHEDVREYDVQLDDCTDDHAPAADAITTRDLLPNVTEYRVPAPRPIWEEDLDEMACDCDECQR